METLCISLIDKWVIVPVTLKSKSLTKIDVKLPATVTHCKGFLFTITDFQGCLNSRILGEASILFNTRKSHPVHSLIEWKNSRYRVSDLLVILNEPVNPGSYISGFIRNYLNYTFSLNLYLLCTEQLTQAD